MGLLEARAPALKLNGWHRLWVLLSALWFLGWLVGFPLYVRSKYLRDAEFVVQKFLDNPKALAPEEVERLASPLARVVRIMAGLDKDSPRLTQELKEEDERFERERWKRIDQLMTRLPPEEAPRGRYDEISRLYDRVNEEMRPQWKNSLFKKMLLTVAKEDISLANVYKRLLKSNWSGWGLYVLLGPVLAYAAVFGFILAVRWVRQGFQTLAGS